ncbi:MULTISPECIES: septum site-determining protein MinC [Paenibacillus]|uniref:Probable septum site-determining protein MinC n=1 Tax=Paenibacillus anseongense TaxID=2682845 RepID=A0ABW9U7C5_9BACL|nr:MULTISPECIES: septum site-determining protein MinC [Paenibacillus]MBA2939299.1 septum site-determining protein MinC [Paenibacillus sp. CGMCC 1.16610]MVQ35258.1 septum site-determining protein MinC [Paenibacillus anseongense]
MSVAKHHVMIKGVKDGLVFLLNDACEWQDLLKELQHKLEKTHQQILTGPIIHVHVKLGSREATEEQKEEIRSVIKQKGNLLIQSIESEPRKEVVVEPAARMSTLRGMIRSGQTLHHEGDLLYLGDVNPGGTITSTGNIYIMGSLRGMAHAGIDGDDKAIIAASHMRPTQLRIAGIISRSPDEWGIEEAFMEFAYVKDGKMEIDKLHQLHRISPDSNLKL